jgi:hypothetical protein
MPYDIQKTPFAGQVVSGASWYRGRGRPPRYPLLQLAVGEWLRVPYSEEGMLWRATRYTNRKASGIKVGVELEEGGKYWIVTRIG